MVKAAEVGMNEAFVPLPNGRSIPVELGDMKLAGFDDLHSAIKTLSDTISKMQNAGGVNAQSSIADAFNSMKDMMIKQLDVASDMETHTRDSKYLMEKLLNAST